MEIGECIRLLVEGAKELDRLHIKSDFDAETVNRIKKALGPWPCALEEEGLVMNKLPNKKVMLECDEQEKKIIELMRQLDFGEIRIIIQNGSPFRVEEIKKSIKL